MKKATIDLSDIHDGAISQYPLSLDSCLSRIRLTLSRFAPDVTDMILNGDAVNGRDIYKQQEVGNVLPTGGYQLYIAAWRWRNFIGDVPVRKLVVTKGNHDEFRGENLAQSLVEKMQLMELPAEYAGRAYIGNFAEDDNPGFYYEAQHGRGGSGDFYANTYAELREALRLHSEYSYLRGIHVSRFLRGHHHMLNVGQPVGGNVVMDTTSGWHRSEAEKFASDLRPAGAILYLYDSDRPDWERLEVKVIPSDYKILASEHMDTSLHAKNLTLVGQALSEVMAWGQERHLW